MVDARILIVEDERIIALDLQRRLQAFGFEVLATVSSGQEAVDMTLSLHPDIVLMDIMLSGDMDGIEAAAKIKEQHRVPIVFLTAYADEATLERAKQTEPFGYILKPFKERELYSTINIALYKSAVDRQVLKQERLFQAILDGVADGLIATDERACVQFMNPVAEMLTGWKEEDAEGLPIADVLKLYGGSGDAPVELPVLLQKGDQSLYTFEDVRLHSRVGAHVHISGTITVIKSEGDKPDGRIIAFRDMTEYKRMSAQFVYQASHDTLTGLLNRHEFIAKLEEIAHFTRDSEQVHSYIYLDLDQFKVVNEVCGHFAGDELVRQVSLDLKQLFEELPPDKYSIGRMGGDEFGAVVRDCPLEQGMEHAQRILEFLRRKFIWNMHVFNITGSVGVVPIRHTEEDVHEIIAAADDACYVAKELGGNMIKVYEIAEHTFIQRRGEMHWISRLTKAIEEDRFVLYGQPVVPLHGDFPEKLEILLRLKDTEGNIINPHEFIPAAEKYNLMPQVDRWVIEAVLRVARRDKDLGRTPRIFCLNISASSIADDNFLSFIQQAFRRYEMSMENFVFEITETTAIENLSRAKRFINGLKHEGALFALDDFGNGFSSFSYLKNLPFDYLKIDGSFVKDIDTDLVDRAMVDVVNKMGHVMGMQTIAEFVRDESIRVLLQEMGVDYAQGYAIAKPSPIGN